MSVSSKRRRERPSQIITRLETEILGLHRAINAKNEQQYKESQEDGARLQQERFRGDALLRELTQPHRVLRIIEYVGSRKRVEEQVRRSIHGTRAIHGPEGVLTITAVTLHEYPEVFENARLAVEKNDKGEPIAQYNAQVAGQTAKQ